MESGEGKEEGRGMRRGWEGRKKMGVKDRCGEERRKAGRGRKKEKGQGREEKRKTAMGTEKERKTSTGLPVSTHTVSLSLPAGWCGFQSVFAKHSAPSLTGASKNLLLLSSYKPTSLHQCRE